ncbi:MAG: hypothetical protein L0287_31375 [Anaerolineae bacterium]|nr:hypothetical protein [Anaerolineae bacterium]
MRTSIAKIFEGLTPEMHTIGAFARNTDEQSVAAWDMAAVKWCAEGWLECRYPANARYLRTLISMDSGYTPIAQENDSKGYAFIEDLQNRNEEFELWYPEPNE